MKKIIFLTAFFILIFFAAMICKFLPYKNLQIFLQREYSAKIYSQDGTLLKIKFLDNGLKREWIDLKDIPDDVVRVFLLAEDKRFFFHFGFDVFAFIRATYHNSKERRVVSGASTITMQLADIIDKDLASVKKNIFIQKIREIFFAVRLELKLSKKEILELWLNSVYFGKNCEGVSSATKEYFNKDLKELTILETIMLANIPKNPTKYNPINKNEFVISAALNLAKNLKIEVDKKSFENSSFLNDKKYQYPNLAPHFTSSIKKSDLKESKKIFTTIDYRLQNYLENRLNYILGKINKKRISNGAVIVIDNKTGDILAYIGSENFFELNSGQIDGVKMCRQPGSTLKPFLYALALEKGWNAGTIISDVPMLFGENEIYEPQNYNNRHNGPVRLRVALASSLNVPAVLTLENLGINNFKGFLIDLEFNSIKNNFEDLGVGLAVGNAEVSLLELTRAWTVFANKGVLNDLNYLVGKEKNCKRIFSIETAEIICDILSDKSSRVLGFGNESALNVNFPAIFKTGTSNQFNNIWALGSTSDISVGVWMGNFSGNSVVGMPGSGYPAMLVRDTMNFYSKKENFLNKTGKYKKIKICALSGKIPNENCPVLIDEIFREKDIIGKCDFHKIDGKIFLPEIYNEWIDNKNLKNYISIQPSEDLKIVSPKNGNVYYMKESIPLENQAIEFFITSKDNNIELSINGKKVKEEKNILRYRYLPQFKGEHTIYVKDKNSLKKINIFVK